jgi:hypothetical protein
MSAVLAMPGILAQATADAEGPVWRPKLLDGLPFYREHTLALLRRYLHISMQIGRVPSPFGKIVFRGRASSYRLQTFEDALIFVQDVEKAINRLDRRARTIIRYVAFEGYSLDEAANLTGDSARSIARIYGDAMDRLTSLLLEFGLIAPNVENLSREEAEIESNDPT